MPLTYRNSSRWYHHQGGAIGQWDSLAGLPTKNMVDFTQLGWTRRLQVQVADIGLMGGPAKFNGKATEGVRIFLGGSIGEGAQLASEFEKGVACEESVLLPKLRELLVERFGAVPKAGVLAEA